ncbi:hypothetical protein P3T16_002845 [Paraburkholderia sp. GAS42]|jgi:hypothetical protein
MFDTRNCWLDSERAKAEAKKAEPEAPQAHERYAPDGGFNGSTSVPSTV